MSSLCNVASEIKIALKSNLGLNHNRLNIDTNDIARKIICKSLYCGTFAVLDYLSSIEAEKAFSSNILVGDSSLPCYGSDGLTCLRHVNTWHLHILCKLWAVHDICRHINYHSFLLIATTENLPNSSRHIRWKNSVYFNGRSFASQAFSNYRDSVLKQSQYQWISTFVRNFLSFCINA